MKNAFMNMHKKETTLVENKGTTYIENSGPRSHLSVVDTYTTTDNLWLCPLLNKSLTMQKMLICHNKLTAVALIGYLMMD